MPVDLQSPPDRPSCGEQGSRSRPQLLPSPDWLFLGWWTLHFVALKAALGGPHLLVNLEGICTAASQIIGVQCFLCRREEPDVLTNLPGLCLCTWDAGVSEPREHKLRSGLQQITSCSSFLCWPVHNIKYFAFTATLNLCRMSTYPQENHS